MGLTGKRIVSAKMDELKELLFLSFYDGSCACIKASYDWDGIELNLADESDLCDDVKLEFGLITQEEIDAIEEQERLDEQAAVEAEELKQYEELKAKYGKKSD